MLPNIIKDCHFMNFKNVLEFNFTVYNSDIVDNFFSMYCVIPLKNDNKHFQKSSITSFRQGVPDIIFSHVIIISVSSPLCLYLEHKKIIKTKVKCECELENMQVLNSGNTFITVFVFRFLYRALWLRIRTILFFPTIKLSTKQIRKNKSKKKTYF